MHNVSNKEKKETKIKILRFCANLRDNKRRANQKEESEKAAYPTNGQCSGTYKYLMLFTLLDPVGPGGTSYFYFEDRKTHWTIGP